MSKEQRCAECGGVMSTCVLPHYTALQIGVAVDLVDTVEEATCTQCGEQDITFPDFNGLMAAIAIARIKTPVKLNGEEIRFLRKALGLTAKEFAQRLSIQRIETVSRWEKGKDEMNPPVEKLLRVAVLNGLGEQAASIPITEMELLLMPTYRPRGANQKALLYLHYGQPASNKTRKAEATSQLGGWEELKQAA